MRSACGIVTGLTTASYAIKPKDGRRNRYQIQAHLPLPEPASQEPAVGEPDQPGAAAAEAPSCVTIAESRGFGPGTLQVNGLIYAMVSRGRFVVKLPRARADTLIASRTYLPFDASKGRPLGAGSDSRARRRSVDQTRSQGAPVRVLSIR